MVINSMIYTPHEITNIHENIGCLIFDTANNGEVIYLNTYNNTMHWWK